MTVEFGGSDARYAAVKLNQLSAFSLLYHFATHSPRLGRANFDVVMRNWSLSCNPALNASKNRRCSDFTRPSIWMTKYSSRRL